MNWQTVIKDIMLVVSNYDGEKHYGHFLFLHLKLKCSLKNSPILINKNCMEII